MPIEKMIAKVIITKIILVSRQTDNDPAAADSVVAYGDGLTPRRIASSLSNGSRRSYPDAEDASSGGLNSPEFESSESVHDQQLGTKHNTNAKL